MGSNHWQALWDNDLIRESLLNEAINQEYEHQKARLEPLYEMYAMVHFALTAILHFTGQLTGNSTIHSELERLKTATLVWTPEQQRENMSNLESELRKLAAKRNA